MDVGCVTPRAAWPKRVAIISSEKSRSAAALAKVWRAWIQSQPALTESNPHIRTS